MQECPDSKGKGLRKTHGRNAYPFDEIDGIGKFLQCGNPEGIFWIIKIEARKSENRNIDVKLWVRRTGDYFYEMAKVFERPAEIFKIYTLTAAMRVASVT